MWHVIEVAELAAELDSHQHGAHERWLRREFYAPLGEEHDTFLTSAPEKFTLIGTWPAAEGIRPPQALVDRLNSWLDRIQRAHTEAVGGPNECLSIVVGVRADERILAVIL